MKTQESSSPQRKAKITQETVARAVGVDKSTVSIVLSKSPRAARISERTQRRIFAAAEQLNYRPNVFASQLRKGRSSFILLCLPTLQDADSAILAEAFERRAYERGYRVIVSCFNGVQDTTGLVENILGPHGISALAMVGSAKDLYDEGAFLRLLDQQICPVLISRTHSHPRVSYVISNEREAGRIAISHLEEQGVRETLVLCDPASRWDVQEQRIAGALERATVLGMADPEIIRVQRPAGVDEIQAGHAAVSERIAKGKPIQSIFAIRDTLAYGAIRALREHGLLAGRDVLVVGSDDRWPAEGIDSGLTCIRQPHNKMGAAAADAVIEQVEGTQPGACRVVFNPELVVRTSSGLRRSVAKCD